MARNEVWLNEDGMEVGFGTRDSKSPHLATVATEGNVEIASMVLDWDHLPAAASTARVTKSMPLPAHSVVTRAYLRVTEEFDSANNTATLDVGFVQKDGTEIDQDGLFAALAQAALGEGSVVEGEGALVGDSVGENDAFISVNVNVEDFEAGQGILTIEYVRPMPTSDAQDPIDGIVGSL